MDAAVLPSLRALRVCDLGTPVREQPDTPSELPPARRRRAVRQQPPPLTLDDLPEDATLKILDQFCKTHKMSQTAKPFRALLAPMRALVLRLHATPWRLAMPELCPVPPRPGWGPVVRFERHDKDSSWYRAEKRIEAELSKENIEDLADVNLKYGAMSHIKQVVFESLKFVRGGEDVDGEVKQDAWNALADAFQKGFLVQLDGLSTVLVDLSEGRCESLATAFAARALRNLTQLQLKEAGIGTDGCVALADAFSKNALPHLKVLALNENMIDALGCKALARAMRERKLEGLETLLLTNCDIGPEGCKELAATLKEDVLPTLSYIQLSGNAIMDEGCEALAEAFKKQARPMLETLGLRSNLITDFAIPRLRSIMWSITAARVLKPFNEPSAVVELGNNLLTQNGAAWVEGANTAYVSAYWD